ncbi:MAG: tRNA uridine-5-carboxymethylaminomethyl(34) synthesis GTPase MnmE [Rickettsiales bacterium]|nr:tRNA uridine-5-carboxymethylaminomethyl(34) synthesis GTPase MnmE [Rickettsiales bacterium]
MNNHSLKDTIYAPASSPQKSGIIVVRVSGDKVSKVITKLKIPHLKPRYATIANIYHPKKQNLIDNCIAIYYKAPHSFTGEDTLELNIHGGKVVLRDLLDALSSISGLRFAEPGEFSMRALFNGKLDLTQVEGLADLINADTSEQHKLALKQLSGSLSKIYDDWRNQLLKIMGLIEAHIDFPEEDIPDDLIEKAENAIKKLSLDINNYLQDNNVGEKLRDGLYIALIGETNVGKSSLINKLSKRDVAIVSNIAGTTRDVIEVSLEIEGYPVTIADTAGIRESTEVIENEGIKRSLTRAKQADCKLIMLDITKESQPQSIIDLIDSNSIVLGNKVDLLESNSIKNALTEYNPLFISIKTGEGFEELINSLSGFVEQFFYSGQSTPVITRQRHRNLLMQCSECLERFSINQGIEFAAEDLRLAASYISQITDRIDADSILGEIFSNFCIGK